MPAHKVYPQVPMVFRPGLAAAVLAVGAASAGAGAECFIASKMTRVRLDLTGFTQARAQVLVMNNGNAAGAAIRPGYMITEAATWSGTTLAASANALNLVVGAGTTGLLRDTDWQDIAAGARVEDVTVGFQIAVALGSTAATVGGITLMFR